MTWCILFSGASKKLGREFAIGKTSKKTAVGFALLAI
jgi:hypothetical protein